MAMRPIFSALMRNKAGLALIVVQVAITLAVICNSLFIVLERSTRVGRPSGMDETGTFTIDSLGFAADYDVRDTIHADLARLRALPGVIDATSTNTTPLTNGGWSTGVTTEPGRGADSSGVQPAAMYFMDEHGLDAFGVRLVEGRAFQAGDVREFNQNTRIQSSVAILTQALADALFPDGGAVGRQIYGIANDNQPVTVIGIVERLQVPWVGWTDVEQSVLVPAIQIDGNFSRYLVRAEPGQRDALMPQVEKALQDGHSGRLVRRMRSIEEARTRVYRQDHAMMSILGGTMVAMLVITGLGIVGLTSFWVTRRMKQIGTRRALGARRGDIRSYFQTENALMIGFGILLGALLTYGFNAWLMQNFNTARLPWPYLPMGALAMAVLGQLAVLGPASRAASVTPALATRTA